MIKIKEIIMIIRMIKIIIEINTTILKEIINHKITNHIIQLTIKLISFIKTEKEIIIKVIIIKIIMIEKIKKMKDLQDLILIEIDYLFKYFEKILKVLK